MGKHIENADGQGQILIGEKLSPVAYHVEVEENGDRYEAVVSMHAPRDWLIRQGFKSRATLVLASGDRAEVKHEGVVDVSDNVSVVLSGEPQSFTDREALIARFPELRVSSGRH